MENTAPYRPRLRDTPKLLFSWRGREKSYFSLLTSAVLVGAIFLMVLGLVRIRVVMPKPMEPRKASVIYLTGDQEGRALALKAQEGGPFPSRFKPSQWEGMADLEAQALAATRRSDIPYVPKLRELPVDDHTPPIVLAAKGVTFFPKHPLTEISIPDGVVLKLAPVIYPLSGIAADAIPSVLPTYKSDIDSVMTSTDWRFLVCLNSNGGVVECVSLGKGGEKKSAELEDWLHQIQFQTVSEKPHRWVAVGIGFINQPADGNHTQ